MTNLVKNYEVDKVAEISISYKNNREVSEMFKVSSSVDVRDFIYPYFDNFIEHHEEIWGLLFNNSNNCLGIYKVAQGGITETSIDIRILMQAALKSNATAMVVVHNHPSGNVIPSQHDDKITKKIKDACTLLNISLLDHLIITSRLFYSYADEYRL